MAKNAAGAASGPHAGRGTFKAAPPSQGGRKKFLDYFAVFLGRMETYHYTAAQTWTLFLLHLSRPSESTASITSPRWKPLSESSGTCTH